MSLSRSDCGGCSATFDTPSRANLRPHTSHPSKGRFLLEGPSGLEEGPTELSNASSSRHESFVEGLWLTSLKGLYPAKQEDLKVSRRGVRPEWEPPYMDCEGSGTHEHRLTSIGACKQPHHESCVERLWRTSRKGLYPAESEPLYVDRDYDSFEAHPYPQACWTISSYCTIFALADLITECKPHCARLHSRGIPLTSKRDAVPHFTRSSRYEQPPNNTGMPRPAKPTEFYAIRWKQEFLTLPVRLHTCNLDALLLAFGDLSKPERLVRWRTP
ncbi:hypothetical protein TNCV_593471 [Trichonephila clavipes]|nr:hypothetical protein TNCV_593471 [Trichonephila clavipes]